MNENHRICPNCNAHDEISEDEFHRMVAANREAAMQAIGVRTGLEARPRFQLALERQGADAEGKPLYALRRAAGI